MVVVVGERGRFGGVVMLGKVGKKEEEKRKGERGRGRESGWVLGGGVFGGGGLCFGGRFRAFFDLIWLDWCCGAGVGEGRAV